VSCQLLFRNGMHYIYLLWNDERDRLLWMYADAIYDRQRPAVFAYYARAHLTKLMSSNEVEPHRLVHVTNYFWLSRFAEFLPLCEMSALIHSIRVAGGRCVEDICPVSRPIYHNRPRKQCRTPASTDSHHKCFNIR